MATKCPFRGKICYEKECMIWNHDHKTCNFNTVEEKRNNNDIVRVLEELNRKLETLIDVVRQRK